MVFAVGVALVAAKRIAGLDWPLARANLQLVGIAGAILLVSMFVRVAGWQRLFRGDNRPTRAALLAASGTATLTGVVLPARSEYVVKATVLRKLRQRTRLDAIAISFVGLGLLDVIAVFPLALGGAVTAPDGASPLRAALIAVVIGSFGAAVMFLAAPRLLARTARSRSPIVGQISTRIASLTIAARQGAVAWFCLSLSWSLRAVALLVLLAGMGIGFSPTTAIIFLTLTAAAGSLPALPGLAIQVGAGAAILSSLHISAGTAIDIAVVSNLLFTSAGAMLIVLASCWHICERSLIRVRER